MGKLPAFQFYPGDWMQDTRCISVAAKGAWIDLLCAMWRSQTRGKLSLPMLGYARLIGATVDQTETLINELIDMRICDSETNGNGNVTLINRRMSREEQERISTRCRVRKFRNAEGKRTCNENVTVPSSSSSSSSCTKVHNIKAQAPPISLPDWLEKDLWDDFREHRKKLRKPMTQRAEQTIINKLDECREKGLNPRHLILTAIERGWLSVFEPKENQ